MKRNGERSGPACRNRGVASFRRGLEMVRPMRFDCWRARATPCRDPQVALTLANLITCGASPCLDLVIERRSDDNVAQVESHAIARHQTLGLSLVVGQLHLEGVTVGKLEHDFYYTSHGNHL